MLSKLFVGNLDWHTDKDEFQSHFSQYGEVEDAHIVTHKETGRSRGFGFITYSSEDSANEAVQNLDNTEFKGRNIAVKIADNNRERSQRNNGNGNGNGGGYGYSNNGRGRGGGGGGSGGGGGDHSNDRRGNSRYNSSDNRRGSTTPRYEVSSQW